MNFVAGDIVEYRSRSGAYVFRCEVLSHCDDYRCRVRKVLKSDGNFWRPGREFTTTHYELRRISPLKLLAEAADG